MKKNNTPPLRHDFVQPQNRDFGKLKVRKIRLTQSSANILKDANSINFDRMSHKQLIDIIKGNDMERKRKLSKWYYEKDGMYARAVRYIADIYKFDFMIYPNIDLDDELKDKKQKEILRKYNQVLEYFDNSSIQLFCRKWAIRVCLEGEYYGYICDDIKDKLVIQDLPTEYCRSRFSYRGNPLVEFNVQYFKKVTSNEKDRERLLNLFPKEIQIGYRKLEANDLPAEEQGDQPGWILLDVNKAFRFNFNDSGLPPFLSAIPALLELDEVQDLEKEKLLQQIEKILVQQFDLDKNGQLPFTMPELQQLNQNAIDMVGDATGISVLSTVAGVHMENLDTNSNGESANAIEAAESDVYNNLGISTNLFNTNGNLALDKSVLIDEAFVKPLLLQFEQFFNIYLEKNFSKKNLKFRLKMLTTSVFNYKDISNSYKDLTKLGFSRFLPMVALGHTQKEIISLAKLEQQILQLDAYMLPPFSSNTMSSDTWSDIKQQQELIIKGKEAVSSSVDKTTQNAASTKDDNSSVGRPSLPDDKKTDKTIANQASQ